MKEKKRKERERGKGREMMEGGRKRGGHGGRDAGERKGN